MPALGRIYIIPPMGLTRPPLTSLNLDAHCQSSPAPLCTSCQACGGTQSSSQATSGWGKATFTPGNPWGRWSWPDSRNGK
jgi:hypothetical protein